MKDLLNDLESQKTAIAVIGLGYVGLPLACLLSEKYKVVGFDINEQRIRELQDGIDKTREVEEREKLINTNLTYTANKEDISSCQLIVVAVPTPIDNFKKPDLRPIIGASKTVGSVMQKGTVVVYESTVYPGCTENDCKTVLEEVSGLEHGKDFFLGYSPERVNPGDKEHTIDKIVKVVSGSTPEVCELLEKVYGSVITAGTHAAPTIATAEAAKVIENTQRDLNIALINELAVIFERVGLDTNDVLEAAGTKWNFLKFKPGLVGGHCIGVDPYYLTHMAQGVGLNPQVILAGRRINDNMGRFVAEKVVRMILTSGSGESLPSEINVAVMGVTFKENVPDLRNTKVVDVIEQLEKFGVKVHAFDPIADAQEYEEEYGRKLMKWEDIPQCDAVISAVKHDVFLKDFGLNVISEKMNPKRKILADLKAIYSTEDATKFGIISWRL